MHVHTPALTCGREVLGFYFEADGSATGPVVLVLQLEVDDVHQLVGRRRVVGEAAAPGPIVHPVGRHILGLGVSRDVA